MNDPLAELEQAGMLLRLDRRRAIDYLGLGQVQRLDELSVGNCLTQETRFGSAMIFKVAGEYRLVLVPIVDLGEEKP